MKLYTIALLPVLALAIPAFGAGRPITVTDLLAMERVSEPQVSPDGTRVVYTVSVPDLSANRVSRNVWILAVQNGAARALTTTGRDSLARWAPDGRRIAFVSQRDGSAQLYILNTDDQNEPVRLTRLSGGVDN